MEVYIIGNLHHFRLKSVRLLTKFIQRLLTVLEPVAAGGLHWTGGDIS